MTTDHDAAARVARDPSLPAHVANPVGQTAGLPGGFFHIEAAHFGQVIWIFEALEQGSFLRRFSMTLWRLLVFAAPQVLLVFVLVLAALRDQRAADGMRAALPGALVGLYVSAAFLGFFTCVGWYSDRWPIPPYRRS